MVSCSAFAPLSFSISPLLHQLSVSRVGYSCVCHLYLFLSPFYPQSVVFVIYMSTPIHTFLFASFLFPIGCICNLHVWSNTHLLPISHLCLAAISLFPEYDIPVSATYSFQTFSFQIVGGMTLKSWKSSEVFTAYFFRFLKYFLKYCRENFAIFFRRKIKKYMFY